MIPRPDLVTAPLWLLHRFFACTCREQAVLDGCLHEYHDLKASCLLCCCCITLLHAAIENKLGAIGVMPKTKLKTAKERAEEATAKPSLSEQFHSSLTGAGVPMAGPSLASTKGALPTVKSLSIVTQSYLPTTMTTAPPAAQGYTSTALAPFSTAAHGYTSSTVTPVTAGAAPHPYSLSQPQYQSGSVAQPHYASQQQQYSQQQFSQQYEYSYSQQSSMSMSTVSAHAYGQDGLGGLGQVAQNPFGGAAFGSATHLPTSQSVGFPRASTNPFL